MINKAPLTLSYDRKEPKDHGEGGQLVGVNEDSHLILIDDVITAGTAMTALIERIKQHSSAHIAALL